MIHKKKHIIWVAWEKHRRTSEIARIFPGIRLFQLEYDAPRLVRYFVLLARTSKVFLKEKPDIVFVQNPSLVLTIYMIIICKMLGLKCVVDAHNEGIRPFSPRLNWLLPMYRLIQKYADLTIVTNHELSEVVAANGGTPFVLADKLPEFQGYYPIELKGKNNIVYICSFEKDEPYQEVIEAARLLDPSIYFHITGNYRKASPEIVGNAPSNVVFCGYLSEPDYINLLYSCDGIIDLTLMENCLVCGAYEAVSLGKPAILSNTKAIRRYFSKGAVYSGNTAQEIAKSVRYFLDNKKKLKDEVLFLKPHMEKQWSEVFMELLAILKVNEQ
ncbi:MAG TPA: glycosyltransferase [Desulfobacteraceae bacterium]|nr:glycosyltransferase [Desulfobacteraceae bacterium]HPJ67678.1 glycosyltransferase [Desulfobacteraceae bacterium]HPQ27810.1 glycosyltransferase [Desulfobacteraceae bacterium]